MAGLEESKSGQQKRQVHTKPASPPRQKRVKASPCGLGNINPEQEILTHWDGMGGMDGGRSSWDGKEGREDFIGWDGREDFMG